MKILLTIEIDNVDKWHGIEDPYTKKVILKQVKEEIKNKLSESIDRNDLNIESRYI